MPLELTAAGLVIKCRTKSVHTAVWITIFLIAFLIINLFGVRGYGEIEILMSIIKVIAVFVAGGGPNHAYLERKYCHDPGPFAHGFQGVYSVFVTAVFYFGGMELIGLAAAEAANPRKTIL